MATVVFLHAHPDDEASQTSGSMARLTEMGDRVVVIYATDGCSGVAPGAGGLSTAEHRAIEAANSAGVLGTQRVEWLGYADSGMTGWPSNQNAGNFMNCDVAVAGRQVADILDDEDADVLVGYDWHGGYGHPDHIQVHRVMNSAADQAKRRPRVLQGTMNRSAMIRFKQMAIEMGMDREGFDPEGPADDGNPIGSLEEEITWRVDVTGWLAKKRASLECHSSQTEDVGMMLSLPEEIFVAMFGHEHYIEDGVDQPMMEAWPFGSNATLCGGASA